MITIPRLLSLLLLLAGGLLPAQTSRVSLVVTQRFDSFSLDPSGFSLAALREFDLTLVTPGPGAAARTWLPTTAFSALWGDAHGDGNYTPFHQWKAPFGERFNFHGLFVKHAERDKGDPKRIYFTIRDDKVNKKFLVFERGGTATHQMRCGDYIRFMPNGNVEFFITQDQIMKAAGPQSGLYIPGASALCQDSRGNLYYSPPQGSPTSSSGGHWVGGRWANDGSIAMIAAKDITYDAQGNVSDVKANSALLLVEEVTQGTNARPSLVDLIKNSGALDLAGSPLTGTANTVGLEIDPGGGTFTGSFPYPGTTNHPQVPNLIFGSDQGNWAGTILSTANGGSIAAINGRSMGATSGKADGLWLGIKSDPANLQPTLMGLALVDEVKEIFTADAPRDGAILASDTTITVDVGYLQSGTPVFLLLVPGPAGPGAWFSPFDMSATLGPESFGWAYIFTPPLFAFSLGLAGSSGKARFSVPKPTAPGNIGATLVFQAVKVNPAWPTVSLSNPVVVQFE